MSNPDTDYLDQRDVEMAALAEENKRLRDALKLLIEYSEYQFMFGQSYHPTLASAINLARQALEGTDNE